MAKKHKIVKTEGPCKWCGHNELYDGICFLCGKLTFLTLTPKEENLENENKNRS